jgi:elongation factor 1-beta
VRVAEIFPGSISVLVVVLRVRNMSRLVARVKMLPSEEGSDVDNIAMTLRQNPPDGIVMKQSTKEPIAFGLYAIVADFLLDDAEGEMDKLETSLKGIAGVGEVEVVFVSRQSVNIK